MVMYITSCRTICLHRTAVYAQKHVLAPTARESSIDGFAEVESWNQHLRGWVCRRAGRKGGGEAAAH